MYHINENALITGLIAMLSAINITFTNSDFRTKTVLIQVADQRNRFYKVSYNSKEITTHLESDLMAFSILFGVFPPSTPSLL